MRRRDDVGLFTITSPVDRTSSEHDASDRRELEGLPEPEPPPTHSHTPHSHTPHTHRPPPPLPPLSPLPPAIPPHELPPPPPPLLPEDTTAIAHTARVELLAAGEVSSFSTPAVLDEITACVARASGLAPAHITVHVRSASVLLLMELVAANATAAQAMVCATPIP